MNKENYEMHKEEWLPDIPEKCPICNIKISPTECYWASYNCCSACIRKVGQGMSFKEFKESIIKSKKLDELFDDYELQVDMEERKMRDIKTNLTPS
jgi:hypothetical protein